MKRVKEVVAALTLMAFMLAGGMFTGSAMSSDVQVQSCNDQVCDYDQWMGTYCSSAPDAWCLDGTGFDDCDYGLCGDDPIEN